jgi:hypothetical protein
MNTGHVRVGQLLMWFGGSQSSPDPEDTALLDSIARDLDELTALREWKAKADAEIAGAVLSRKCAEDYAASLEKRIGELIAAPEPPRDTEAVFCTQDGAVWLFRDEGGHPVVRVQGGLFTTELFLGDMYPEAARQFADAFDRVAGGSMP